MSADGVVDHRLFALAGPSGGVPLADAATAVIRALTAWAAPSSASTPWAAPGADELDRAVAALDPCPDEGVALERVLDEIGRTVLANGVRVTHPRCAAHLHAPALTAAVATELAVAATNQSLDSFDQSPAATVVEQHLMGWLARLLGLPAAATGVLTSGGTVSNLLGLLLARHRATVAGGHDLAAGLPTGSARWRIVTSEAAHFSVAQASAVLGLGERAVVTVPVDHRGAMDIAGLDAVLGLLQADGLVPIAIVATAGTTDLGGIDPLPAVADRARACGVWLHVDAAVGAGLALSPRLRPLLAGVEAADSVTADFHKLFWLPVASSALLVRDASSFDLIRRRTDYLNRDDDASAGVVNLVDRSLDTSRRFDALTVLVALRTTGRRRLAAMVERVTALADAAADAVARSGTLELLAPAGLVTVVFRCCPPDVAAADLDALNTRVQRQLLAAGDAVIGRTRWRGAVALKLTLVNPLTTAAEMAELVALIDAAGRRERATLRAVPC